MNTFIQSSSIAVQTRAPPSRKYGRSRDTDKDFCPMYVNHLPHTQDMYEPQRHICNGLSFTVLLCLYFTEQSSSRVNQQIHGGICSGAPPKLRKICAKMMTKFNFECLYKQRLDSKVVESVNV